MTCCCDQKQDETGIDDGIDPCCSECVCFPYKDSVMITAQVFSVVAFLVSWVWWVTWLFSAAGMIMLQIVWCCRQNRFAFLASAIISGIAALSCLFAGIWMLFVWKDVSECYPFDWLTVTYDDDYDLCTQRIWAGIAFFDAVLWLVVTKLVLYFVYGGRHQKWENKFRKKSDDNGVELTPGEAETNVASQATAVLIEETKAIPVSKKDGEDASV